MKDRWIIYTQAVRLNLILLEKLGIHVIDSTFEFLFTQQQGISEALTLPMITVDPDAMRLVVEILRLLTTVSKHRDLIQMERYQLCKHYTVRINILPQTS